MLVESWYNVGRHKGVGRGGSGAASNVYDDRMVVAGNGRYRVPARTSRNPLIHDEFSVTFMKIVTNRHDL